MGRVVHFEIPADDPERAVKFYENVFGWDIQTRGGPAYYWLADTGPADEPGINGAVMRRPEWGTCSINISVPSLDEHLKRVREAGGKIVQPKSRSLASGTWPTAETRRATSSASSRRIPPPRRRRPSHQSLG